VQRQTAHQRQLVKPQSRETRQPQDKAQQGARAMSRIVVLGCAGSGKTTFARRLGARIGAPVICLDAIRQPNWGKDDVLTFRTLMKEAHSGDTWISDGNFAQATFDICVPRATLVIWIDRPKMFCVWHAIARVFQPGEEHRIGRVLKVLRFIWNFDRINRPLIEAQRIAHGSDVPVRRLTNDRELAAFLSSCDRDLAHS
jgi:adenylate kinase family enzyme